MGLGPIDRYNRRYSDSHSSSSSSSASSTATDDSYASMASGTPLLDPLDKIDADKKKNDDLLPLPPKQQRPPLNSVYSAPRIRRQSPLRQDSYNNISKTKLVHEEPSLLKHPLQSSSPLQEKRKEIQLQQPSPLQQQQQKQQQQQQQQQQNDADEEEDLDEPPSLLQRRPADDASTYQHPLLTVDPNEEEVVADDADDDTAAEEKILKVVDQVEDEWEELAYEQLVPLEVKLALERNVFGWSHLTSDILGHLLFTIGSFSLTFTALWLLTPKSPSKHSYRWLRWFLSLLAAWSSFRMVRRRRRVWFRAPYGSEQYRKDEPRRRKEIIQADNLSWIQRLRLSSKQRKVEKQLQRAESNFQRHHIKRLERALSYPPTSTLPEDEPPAVNNKEGVESLKYRKLSFRTDSIRMMQSVQQDQIMFTPGPIQRVPYSHGGGFGAAPFMLANPHWIAVLRHLMPDVYVEISRRVNAPPHKLIHWAENNPVVAAYATAHELEYDGTITNIEWDVFLDPHLVYRVQIVLQERQKFLLSVLPELPTTKPMERIPDLEFLSPSQRNVVKYYERELRKRAQLLVDRMLIAHGNLAQLSMEQTGFLKHYNYSRVKRTRRTLGGGIFARQWFAVYAESLRVGVLEENPASPGRVTKSSLLEMAHSVCPNSSIAASVEIVRYITKREDPIGLVLDVKSRHVPNQVWACVVDILRETGVRVEGVGSFVMDEIRTLSKFTVQPVNELLFFHSAGDLQHACHNKLIRYGDQIFFNGGSLLWSPRFEHQSTCTTVQQCCQPFDPEAFKHSYRLQPYALPSRAAEGSYQAMPDFVLSTIEDYKKRYNLKIGLYVQEFAIDNVAADILVDLVNRYPDIYDLGLSWGGVNGITLRGIRPGRFTETTGYWNQRHLGCPWNNELRPPV